MRIEGIAAITISTDKEVRAVALTCLEDKQRCVGGWIEPVMLQDGSTMYVNEEGKLNRLPFNSIATDLALMNTAIMFNDAIVGNVVVVGPLTRAGNDTSITAKTVNQIQRIAREAITDPNELAIAIDAMASVVVKG